MRASSTEIGSILHMNHYKSRSCLFREKQKGYRRPPWTSEAMRYGIFHESDAIKQAMTHLDPEKRYQWAKPGVIMDPFSPTCCSPDMIFFEPSYSCDICKTCPNLDNELKCLECRRILKEKAHLPFFGLEVKVPFSRGIPQKPEDIDTSYIIQCFSCLHITGADCWYLYFYDPKDESRGRLYQVHPNPRIWVETIVPKVQEFFRETHVERKNDYDRICAEYIRAEISVLPVYILNNK